MSLKLFIHDVGHGHAIHAFTPAGEAIVIDLGSSSTYSPLALLAQKTSLIDLLVISHPHGDHISEVESLSRHGFRIRQINRPKWLTHDEISAANRPSEANLITAYESLSANYSNPIQEAERVGNPAVSAGVSIDVFYSANCGRSNINNHSAVVVFKYQSVGVVIPGDNESPSWKELLLKPAFVGALPSTAFFLASHHGRKSGFYADLFHQGRLSPKLCAVSDGPVTDTDVTNDYSGQSVGWNVLSRGSGQSASRLCLTTRSDGTIILEIGADSLGNPYMNVTKD